MQILVGNTGFVGSNLASSETFDYCFNSKNVQEAYGLRPDLMVYAGVTGTKYIANCYPERDTEVVQSAIDNICKINPARLVLISTVDVNSSLDGSNELSTIEKEKLNVYGLNRYILEEWVIQNISAYYIIRLPAIYGKNLKKNYIYDLIHRIPQNIPSPIFECLIKTAPFLLNYYDKHDEYFWVLKVLDQKAERELETFYKHNEFNSLMFTASSSQYQFYNLKYLRNDIRIVIDNNIRLINLVTEPVIAAELYQYIYEETFHNFSVKPCIYNIKTIYSNLFQGDRGYIASKHRILKDIKQFVLAGGMI